MKLKNNIAVSETGFIFVPTTGDSFSVNPIGVEIIEMLKDNVSEKDIFKKLISRYDTDDTSLAKDYYDFVNQLKQHNLIAEEE